tara:strand:- start:1046 stop:1504 length:459 start_codon:yes stop_codon:yes gene_type:complete
MPLESISGNKLGLFITGDAEGSGASRLVGVSTNCSVSINNGSVETASKSGQAAQSISHTAVGASSFSFSVDGMVDIATAADDMTGADEHGFNNLAKLALSGETCTVIFKASTGTTYTGSAFIESLEATAGVDSFATYSCSLKGTGTLVQATS